ncbi:eukaryotic translation initiation factor 4 gamma isoform X2 [Ooceraea biroi]|uniref:eukaryotic translation initiation factor 4 gamma isoform X2 n=1 Tax=Ooceraea biroi TaxID=2015173 RepID=UPI0005B9AEDA|nr:eukaryotic translation initiation factor 4 gamma isoform X2 [Ooceraea biroi]
MEISESDIQGRNQPAGLISVYVKQENDESETDLNEVEIITAAQHFCAIEIKESKDCKVISRKAIDKDCAQSDTNVSNTADTAVGNAQHAEGDDGIASNVLANPIYLDALDPDSINIEFQKQQPNTATEVFVRNGEQVPTNNYNISAVTISNEFLNGININIKKEDNHGDDHGTLYTTEWLCDGSNDAGIQLRVLKDAKQNIQIPIRVDTGAIAVAKRRKGQLLEGEDTLEQEKAKISRRSKKHIRLKSTVHQDYRERLRRKAECMREKRKKLYEQESEEQRLERLAKEAAKRREMRMYYETPEQRRKRLDAEAARKREYRMYNETPEDRRKRLDREAERRRVKRLSMYASETPEQRRERLNKESAKRREARLNQYSKETEEERRQRLRRDALRARQMRFTRSTVETEEERRQRIERCADEGQFGKSVGQPLPEQLDDVVPEHIDTTGAQWRTNRGVASAA